MMPLDASESRSISGGPSFSLSSRLLRVGWRLTWLLLASWTPPPMHSWRRLVLVAFGARMHPTARVYGSAKIWYPANLEMEAHATLGPSVICYNMDRISMGRHVVVSQGAHLCCGSHDIRNASFQLFTRPIKIGQHAWICAEAFVGPGVSVGEGAVLAAKAAAFQDLDQWGVYRGNPAERIKGRPRLLEINQ